MCHKARKLETKADALTCVLRDQQQYYAILYIVVAYALLSLDPHIFLVFQTPFQMGTTGCLGLTKISHPAMILQFVSYSEFGTAT